MHKEAGIFLLNGLIIAAIEVKSDGIVLRLELVMGRIIIAGDEFSRLLLGNHCAIPHVTTAGLDLLLLFLRQAVLIVNQVGTLVLLCLVLGLAECLRVRPVHKVDLLLLFDWLKVKLSLFLFAFLVVHLVYFKIIIFN